MPTIKTGKHGTYTVKENKNLFLYPQEWAKIERVANSRQVMSMAIQLQTGARINEARHIKVEDIDFNRNNIILKQTKVRAKLGEKKPTPRIIPISSKFAKDLRKYINKYKLKSSDYFPMLNHQGQTYAVKQSSKKIGREDWRDFSSHNLRKTFESWLVALGIDSLKIIKHLGHDFKTAATSYVSSDIFTYDDKKMIRNILGDLYSYNERF